jgi:hypothetical protein
MFAGMFTTGIIELSAAAVSSDKTALEILILRSS